MDEIDLYTDWIDYCKNQKDFDWSHFLGLFKIGLNDDKLKKVLQYFPNSEDIFLRLKEVLDAGDMEDHLYLMPAKKFRLEPQELINVAKEWQKECASFCINQGEMELYQIITNAEVVFASKDEVWKEKMDCNNPEAEIYELLGDKIDKIIFETEQSDALLEAAYGIAADYNLSRFICQPLIGLNIYFRKYFEFWKGGGFGVLLADKLLVGYFLED